MKRAYVGKRNQNGRVSRAVKEPLPFRIQCVRVLLFLPALFFLSVCFITVNHDWHYVEKLNRLHAVRSVQTEGWISEIHEARARNGGVYFAGTLSYKTVNGDTVTAYLDAVRDDWKVGDRHDIWIDPAASKNYSFRKTPIRFSEINGISSVVLLGIAFLLAINGLIQGRKLR